MEIKRPDWVPEKAGAEFTTMVMRGVDGGHDGLGVSNANRPQLIKPPSPKRRHLSVEEYVEGVLAGERNILARTITLVESNAPAHMNMAQEVLRQLLPHAGNSIRIGITGVPGVGKSTTIETLGLYLLEKGHKVAVLAVDPSSKVTGGSILGDKTRMEELSRDSRAFIRPSPSGGTLGGVTRKSRETILVCEAAGFDVILVETVGVGQSETTVRQMVDFFLLLMLAGAGDELQGIKKGIMELADALIINKADGENKPRALAAKLEYNRALTYLAPATEGWQTHAYTCSATTGEGISEFWSIVEAFRKQTVESGTQEKRRHTQTLEWVYAMVEEYLQNSFYQHAGVKAMQSRIKRDVISGEMPPTIAAKQLIEAFET
uniref:Methylmalonyl-CoA mutase metallochaperone MeaB n=1 Tax=Candidatus Kentrum sp. MB TaxID=2138164 RepID=A0A450XF17_9GAMM|nr:MAG: methylmalonyl-CoA mutase metallochaperone MeaB [Candidatus Kentron sp. MB]VFK31800.1 MAG: methylmalonyl-CoA mutase metallochaperone MeaB [Candidatus Kentron sp. MB]VFK75570.1 MAG: methylmalonyl-CoA mutase metallochaperone MeaB [Candidatus Kentron sp. MB]